MTTKTAPHGTSRSSNRYFSPDDKKPPTLVGGSSLSFARVKTLSTTTAQQQGRPQQTGPQAPRGAMRSPPPHGGGEHTPTGPSKKAPSRGLRRQRGRHSVSHTPSHTHPHTRITHPPHTARPSGGALSGGAWPPHTPLTHSHTLTPHTALSGCRGPSSARGGPSFSFCRRGRQGGAWPLHLTGRITHSLTHPSQGGPLGCRGCQCLSSAWVGPFSLFSFFLFVRYKMSPCVVAGGR